MGDIITSHSHDNVVGEGLGNVPKRAKAFTNVYKRIPEDYKQIAELVVYYKAVRRVGNYLGLDVGEREIRALAVVWMWCWQFERQGGPMSKIIDWSGYTRTWQGRMKTGINACLNSGLLEWVRVRGGPQLRITTKGESVIRALKHKSIVVIEEMEGKREKPKRQTR